MRRRIKSTMKKFLSFCLALLAVSAFAQDVKIPDYVRGSIYSIRLDVPISSKMDFKKEVAAMKNAFDTLNYETHFRKYNGFNVGKRVMTIGEATDEEAQQIAAIMGRKNPNETDKRAAAILKKLEEDKVANKLVCKWFSKEGNDGSSFDFDESYATIAKLGLMSLSEDDKSNAQTEGTASLDKAKAMADPLLNSTYVIVSDFDFMSGAEMVDKKLAEKTAPLYAKLEKAPAMLKASIQSTIESTIQTAKGSLEAAFPADLRLVESHSYLYRLVWDSEKSFYANGLDKDFSKADYHLEYVNTASGYAALVTMDGVVSEKNAMAKVAKKSIAALDANINRLGNKCPEFSPIEILYTTDDGKYYVKAGTEEGLSMKSEVTPLAKVLDKKTGAVALKVAGSLKVEKGGLWNNNTDPDDIEQNQKSAEDKGDPNLTYTTLTGSAKNAVYVKLVSPKAYKDAEAKMAKKAKK